MILVMRRRAAVPRDAVGPFNVHPGHPFEGFQIERRGGRELLVARCSCGEVLDVAEPAFEPCPDCSGERGCARCGGSGQVIDHAALVWRPPDETEERDADDA
jgi:hypothetical protein